MRGFDTPRQKRVLARCLESAAIARFPVEVDVASQPRVDPVSAHLRADHLAIFVGLFEIPACSARYRGRQRGGRAQGRVRANRPIRVEQIRNAEPWNPGNILRRAAGSFGVLDGERAVYELELLCQGHLTQQEVRGLVRVRRQWRGRRGRCWGWRWGGSRGGRRGGRWPARTGTACRCSHQDEGESEKEFVHWEVPSIRLYGLNRLIVLSDLWVV